MGANENAKKKMTNKSVRMEGNIRNVKHPEEYFKNPNIYYLVDSFTITELYTLWTKHTK